MSQEARQSEPVLLDGRDALAAGAAVRSYIDMHDAISEIYPLTPISHRDQLERIATELGCPEPLAPRPANVIDLRP